MEKAALAESVSATRGRAESVSSGPFAPFTTRGGKKKQRVGEKWSSLWRSHEEAVREDPAKKGQQMTLPRFSAWNKGLGMPPYLEMSARLLWEAAAACGDAGKLCPEGFVLFDNWHKGFSKHQELWTAYGRLNGMFSKSHKADKEVCGKAEGADYWLHS